MPAIEKCEGCCVKLVQNIGSPLYSVRRTCTDNLGQISNILIAKFTKTLYKNELLCMKTGKVYVNQNQNTF